MNPGVVFLGLCLMFAAWLLLGERRYGRDRFDIFEEES